jgi:hypothetical protein
MNIGALKLWGVTLAICVVLAAIIVGVWVNETDYFNISLKQYSTQSHVDGYIGASSAGGNKGKVRNY